MEALGLAMSTSLILTPKRSLGLGSPTLRMVDSITVVLWDPNRANRASLSLVVALVDTLWMSSLLIP